MTTQKKDDYCPHPDTVRAVRALAFGTLSPGTITTRQKIEAYELLIAKYGNLYSNLKTAVLKDKPPSKWIQSYLREAAWQLRFETEALVKELGEPTPRQKRQARARADKAAKAAAAAGGEDGEGD